MKRAIVVGIAGGIAFSVWTVLAMLWPISYRAWDIGRGVLYVAFIFALIGVAASVARSRAVAPTFGSVAVASLLSAALTLTTYAIWTGVFSDRILQLPEYFHDYTYHGYTSPEVYLTANYSALLRLQVLAWTIAVSGQVLVAGTAGWFLRRVTWLPTH